MMTARRSDLVSSAFCFATIQTSSGISTVVFTPRCVFVTMPGAYRNYGLTVKRILGANPILQAERGEPEMLGAEVDCEG
jgi:hypothetical protein